MENIEKPLFYSARLKIKRANQHIQELVRVLHAFPQADVHHIGIEEDAKTAGSALKLEIADNILDDIPLIIGDAIHNLRTALDHVAYELVTLSGGTPTYHTKFTIGETRKETVTALGGVIQGVGLDILTCIIEYVQPYRGGNDALYALHTLDIADKHRLLVPIFTTVEMEIVTRSHGQSFGYLAFVITPSEKTPMIRNFSRSKIESYSNPMLRVIFEGVEGFKNQPVIPTLLQLSQLVSHTIQIIERAFLDMRK